MLHPDLVAQVSREQRSDWLAAAERRRRAALAREPRAALTRRAATPLGRALVRLGTGLLRYGRAESPVATSSNRASARSIRLN